MVAYPPKLEMDSKTLGAFVSPASGYVETKSKNPFALSANADNSEPSETKSVPPVKILAIESPAIISIKEPKEVIKSPIPSKGTVLKISKNGLTFSAKPAKFCPIVGKEFVIPSATPPTSEPTIVPICSNNLARVSAPESMNVVNPGICCKAPKAAINIVKPPKIVANPIIPDKNVAGLNAPIIAIAPVMRINDGLPKTVIALNNVVNNDAPLPKNAVNPGIVVNKPNASNNIVKPPKIIAISASPFINELGFIFDITEVNNVSTPIPIAISPTLENNLPNVSIPRSIKTLNPGIVDIAPYASTITVKPPKIIAISASPLSIVFGFGIWSWNPFPPPPPFPFLRPNKRERINASKPPLAPLPPKRPNIPNNPAMIPPKRPNAPPMPPIALTTNEIMLAPLEIPNKVKSAPPTTPITFPTFSHVSIGPNKASKSTN